MHIIIPTTNGLARQPRKTRRRKVPKPPPPPPPICHGKECVDLLYKLCAITGKCGGMGTK